MMAKPRCTHCGADLTTADPGSLAVCEHCGAALYLDLSGSALHYLVAPSVPDEEAASRLRRALVAREMLDDIEVVSTTTQYLPYFCWGDVRRDRLFSALALPEEDVREAPNLRGDLAFFDETRLGHAAAVSPELRPHEVCGPIAGESSVQLVHVPFHRIHYNCQGRHFTALVDAMAGRVSADEWPVSPMRELNAELWLLATAWGASFVLAVTLLPSWPWILTALAGLSVGGYQASLWRLRRRGW